MQLVELGVLERYGVEVIGARPEAISTAEDRDRFKAAMEDIGLEVPRRASPTRWRRPRRSRDIGFPIMVRPSFILGGKGTGIAEDAERFAQLAAEGLAASPVGQILVEQSIAGLEGIRARGDPRRARTTASWCAPSRTSTPWASTPATPSRWPRPRR